MAEGGNSRSLRSRRLEVMGARKNRRARGRHARLEFEFHRARIPPSPSLSTTSYSCAGEEVRDL